MLYCRMMLTMLVTLYTSRVILNTLGVEDFGIYNVIGGVVAMFSFLNTAMASGTQRFLSYELGRNDLVQFRKVFSITLTIHIGIAIIILLLAETIGLWFLNTRINIPVERMEAARWIFQFSTLSFLVTVIQAPYNASIIAYEHMSAYAYVSIIEVILKLLIVFILTWASYDKLKLYSVLMFAVIFITVAIYRFYCKKKFKGCDYYFVWDRAMYLKLLGYASWNLFGSFAYIGFTQGINILLNIFFGPVVNAARAVAYQVNLSIQTLAGNFQLAANPQIIKSYAADDKNHMMELIFQSSRYSFYLLLLFSLPMFLEAEMVLKAWLKIVPDYTSLFCRLIIINAMIDCVSCPLTTAAQATGIIKKYQAVVGSVLLLNVPVSYLFLRFGFSPEVTIYVSIVLSAVALFFRLLILRNLINLSIRHFIMRVVVASFLVGLVASLIPSMLRLHMIETHYRFFIVCLVAVLSSLLSVYFIGLNSSEKNFILKRIATLFNQIKLLKT